MAHVPSWGHQAEQPQSSNASPSDRRYLASQYQDLLSRSGTCQPHYRLHSVITLNSVLIQASTSSVTRNVTVKSEIVPSHLPGLRALPGGLSTTWTDSLQETTRVQLREVKESRAYVALCHPFSHRWLVRNDTTINAVAYALLRGIDGASGHSDCQPEDTRRSEDDAVDAVLDGMWGVFASEVWDDVLAACCE